MTTCRLFAFLFSFAMVVSAEEGEKKQLRKTATNDNYRTIAINNIFTYYSNCGDGSFSPYVGGSGFEFPKGSGITAIYEDGLVWGGIHRGSLKVGGSTFRHGLQAGKVLTAGTAITDPVAASSSDPHYRLYSVRRDISPRTSESEALSLLWDEALLVWRYDLSTSVNSLFERYVQDWIEWPAAEGAPYEDVNGNGVYEPSIDIPGVPSADQTMWHISNDLDAVRTQYLYGTPPIGIEMQRCIWAYRGSSNVDGAIFVRTVLVNKSAFPVDSMFIGFFSDPDLGDAGDDLKGFDTTLGMTYVYNGRDRDNNYGTAVPAVGFLFLQTPVVPGLPSDTATLMFHRKPRMRNLPLYSANTLFKHAYGGEPPLGSATGATMAYNWLRGYSVLGLPFVNPLTGETTRFLYPGDPLHRNGWFFSMELPPQDQRVTLSTGPFTFAAGDTQEVVTVTFAAGSAEPLYSIPYLRLAAQEMRAMSRNAYLQTHVSPPVVSSFASNNAVTLIWDDSTNVPIESLSDPRYAFQGYVVSQYADSLGSMRNVIATYDVADELTEVREYSTTMQIDDVVNPVAIFGRNTGIRRYFRATYDHIGKIPIVNGRQYYYSVQTYATAKSSSMIPPYQLSSSNVITVTPQSPKPGTAWRATFGTLVDTLRLALHGENDARLRVRVIDPSRITGHRYAMIFSRAGSDVTWSLIDSTTGTSHLEQQSGFMKDVDFDRMVSDPTEENEAPPLSASAPIVDGLQWIVNLPSSASDLPETGEGWSLSTEYLQPIHDDRSLELAAVNNITVYPNPYFSFNAGEPNKYIRFVTFGHLPQRAAIRIFSLGGTLTKTIIKDDATQFARWDLTNESNVWVSAGMYIVYIEMPGLGATKVLKLAVMPQAFIPDHY